MSPHAPDRIELPWVTMWAWSLAKTSFPAESGDVSALGSVASLWGIPMSRESPYAGNSHVPGIPTCRDSDRVVSLVACEPGAGNIICPARSSRGTCLTTWGGRGPAMQVAAVNLQGRACPCPRQLIRSERGLSRWNSPRGITVRAVRIRRNGIHPWGKPDHGAGFGDRDCKELGVPNGIPPAAGIISRGRNHRVIVTRKKSQPQKQSPGHNRPGCEDPP